MTSSICSFVIARREVELRRVEQPGHVPVLEVLAEAVLRDEPADRGLDRVDGLFAEVFAVEDLLAALVDDLALLVHHLVVLEHVLADLEVAILDRALRALDRLRHHLRLERHVVGERRVHHARHETGREQAHELVFERQIEAALARVALATGAAAQLVVDAARLVAFGTEHVETAELAHLLALGLALRLELRQQLLVARVELGRARARALPSGTRAGPGPRGCRRAGCRRRGRPCSWPPSPRRACPPA